MAKTREEVEALKQNWLDGGGYWDLFAVEEFADYHDELIAFQQEHEQRWRIGRNEKEEARATLVREQTGVLDAEIVSSLHTWNEIENVVSNVSKHIRQFMNTQDEANAELLQAQVRATLLQAAQLKRIADALEAIQASDSLSETVRICGTGE